MSMQKKNIEKLVEETLQSFEAAKRAVPKPFLLTRVMAAIEKNASEKNGWSRASAFISKPAVAAAAIAFIIFINMGILFLKKNDPGKIPGTQNSTLVTDDFAINAANIYDIENLESQ
jgi:hypothetical protein